MALVTFEIPDFALENFQKKLNEAPDQDPDYTGKPTVSQYVKALFLVNLMEGIDHIFTQAEGEILRQNLEDLGKEFLREGR